MPPRSREARSVNLEWFDVGHPVPTAGSVAAGSRALALAAGLAPDEILVLLLSGGASAGLAAPIAGLTLEDKSATTAVLLRAGVAIDGLNCVRKHLSAIKGGRLAVAARGRIVTLAISDVVDPAPDDPARHRIGTDYTRSDGRLPRPWRFAGRPMRSVPCRRQPWTHSSEALAGTIEESPKPEDVRLADAVFHLIGSRRDAIEGAARKAARARVLRGGHR